MDAQFCQQVQQVVPQSTFKPEQPAYLLSSTVASSSNQPIRRTFAAVVAAIPPTIGDTHIYYRPETLTCHSIELYWAPLKCATDHYVVEVKNKKKEWEATKHKLLHSAEKKIYFAKISKLEPNTVFSFRVRVWGKNGRPIGILAGSGGLLSVRTPPKPKK